MGTEFTTSTSLFLGNAKRKRKLLGKNLEKTLNIITKINTELTNNLGTYLNVVFFALSIADVKKGGFHFKKKQI